MRCDLVLIWKPDVVHLSLVVFVGNYSIGPTCVSVENSCVDFSWVCLFWWYPINTKVLVS